MWGAGEVFRPYWGLINTQAYLYPPFIPTDEVNKTKEESFGCGSSETRAESEAS